MPSITPLLRPRPRLVSETPQADASTPGLAAFHPIPDAARIAFADCTALMARLSRTFTGPGNCATDKSFEVAEADALELADAAHALAKALGR